MPTASGRKHERLFPWAATAQPPLGEVGGKRGMKLNRPRLPSLGLLELSESERSLDENRALANVAPSERKRFAGPQSGVSQHRVERGIAKAVATKERGADRFDFRMTDRLH